MQWEKLRFALEDAGHTTMSNIITNACVGILGGHKHALVRVRVRVGQGAFRQKLLSEQGAVCAFSGPVSADVLEAAHPYSYANLGEHRDEGGLLLRRDLHRLFDLGRIAVDPESLQLDVDGGTRSHAPYDGLHGAPVIAHVGKPSAVAGRALEHAPRSAVGG